MSYIQGDLDQAEAFYRKALALNKELGIKEGMASAYKNLGLVYWRRRDLGQAEIMYRQALALYKEMGVAPEVEQVQKSLRAIHAQ